MSDVKFDGEVVIVEGQWLRSQTWDLMLDAPDRRLFPGGVRRALVHDPNDRLTINYQGDYPNGVQVQGRMVVDSLFVRGDAGFAKPLTTPSICLGTAVEPAILRPDSPLSGVSTWGMDVKGALQSLQDEIKQLKDRVAELEAVHK